MSSFISKDYEQYREERTGSWTKLNASERVIDLLTWMAGYCEKMGIDFVAGYLSPQNHVLNVKDVTVLTKYHKKIISDIILQLETAQSEGIICS